MDLELGAHKAKESKAVPFINVTPLIDVLLVMLIIFMVITPLKPSRCVGMSAWKRLGLSGVITMKMMSITKSTSISGVTLIYGTALLSFAL